MGSRTRDKAGLRRWAIDRRSGVELDHGRYCRSLAAFLDERVPPGRRVVLYDALGDEVRLDDLVAAHPRPEHRYALTRTPDTGRRLTVHPWGSPTERHRYGYSQPRADASIVPDADIGAVLVPGLAFDRRGHRLGRGAGYYDRFLARLGPDVARIGITGEMIVDELPFEDHDVVMTHLATAGGIEAVAPPGAT